MEFIKHIAFDVLGIVVLAIIGVIGLIYCIAKLLTGAISSDDDTSKN